MTPKRSPRVRGARANAAKFADEAAPNLVKRYDGWRKQGLETVCTRAFLHNAYLAGWRASQRAGKRKGRK
jgi:hypothetical protein